MSQVLHIFFYLCGNSFAHIFYFLKSTKNDWNTLILHNEKNRLKCYCQSHFVLTIDVTMHQCDSSDNVCCCSEVTKQGWIDPAAETILELGGTDMFSCGVTTHRFLFLYLTQNNTFCASAPYNNWPQSKAVSYSVLWKGQWSCDADRSALSSLCSVRYEVQAGSTAVSILSNCDSFRLNTHASTQPAVVWIICNWVHWARCVGEHTHCKLK